MMAYLTFSAIVTSSWNMKLLYLERVREHEASQCYGSLVIGSTLMTSTSSSKSTCKSYYIIL